jgi:preprotein translocase subunit YajC
MRAILASFAAVLPVAALAEAPAAMAPGAPVASSPMASLLPLVLIFFVFYFLLIKPQQKRMKEHQATLAALKKGDEVITGGGIIGRITKVSDDKLTVEISKGVEVTVLKSGVSGLANAPAAPAPAKKKAAGNKNDNVVPSRDNVANDN